MTVRGGRPVSRVTPGDAVRTLELAQGPAHLHGHPGVELPFSQGLEAEQPLGMGPRQISTRVDSREDPAPAEDVVEERRRHLRVGCQVGHATGFSRYVVDLLPTMPLHHPRRWWLGPSSEATPERDQEGHPSRVHLLVLCQAAILVFGRRSIPARGVALPRRIPPIRLGRAPCELGASSPSFHKADYLTKHWGRARQVHGHKG